MSKISIVMPCLNRVHFIKEALESIYSQNVNDVEVIVADGGSTDGTLDVIKKFSKVKLLIGPDTGLYEALNKAILVSTGDIIGHLNTDDIYLPGTFELVLNAFNSNENLDMVCGSAELACKAEDGAWKAKEYYDAESHAQLTWPLVLKGAILTNARFYSRKFLIACGPFDESYKFIADRKFLIKALEMKPLILPVHKTILQYRQHPGSLTFNDNAISIQNSLIEKVRLARSKHLDAKENATEEKRYHDWGRYEASLGLINAIRLLSLSSIKFFFREGKTFGPGWNLYLINQIQKRTVAKIYKQLKSKK